MMQSITVDLPNRPTITIHKGWAPSKTCRNVKQSKAAVDQLPFDAYTFSIRSPKGQSTAAKSAEEGKSASQVVSTTEPWRNGQQFDFVNNASEPLHTKDAAVRKLVRSHAMQQVVRKRREGKRAKLKNANTKSEKIRRESEESRASEVPPDQVSGDNITSMHFDYCFNNYVSKIRINISRLKSLYFTQLGSAVFPIEFHHAYDPPLQLWSLDQSFANEGVVYQSLRYAAAVCSTLAEGKRYSSEIAAQMGLTIVLINKLLDGGLWMADGMLGAVCHLAIGEVSKVTSVTSRAYLLMLERFH